MDSHFAAVQSLDDQIEQLQEELFAEAGAGIEVQRRSFQLRKSLVLLRRVVLPMREVVNSLMRRDIHLLDEEMTHYYQDVYDHVLRAAEWTESLATRHHHPRDPPHDPGQPAQRDHEEADRLGGDHRHPDGGDGLLRPNRPLPRFGQTWGIVFSVVLIAVIAGSLYAMFKRKGWL